MTIMTIRSNAKPDTGRPLVPLRLPESAVCAPAMQRTSAIYIALLVLFCVSLTQQALADEESNVIFQRVPTQFIAALGDPDASSGTGAETWGIWRSDPGPRGVWLTNFNRLEEADGVAPARWQFDKEDWWLDENGLIMEKPNFPIPPGQYIVTGDRETISMLTVHPRDESGGRRWELNRGATLYDVTHLPCRSARYTTPENGASCSPGSADLTKFPVTPGAAMPAVDSCAKQDYAVLFIIAIGMKQ